MDVTLRNSACYSRASCRSPPGLAQAGGTLREGQAYAVNGQRPESNNLLIDGSDNFNGVDGGFVLEPPVDAILREPKTLSRCNDVVEGEKKPGAWEGKSPHRVLNMPSNYS